jgi:small conductance mechanosensitive channel
MHSVHQQFPGILMTTPSSEGRIKLEAGKEILRIKFRIWPNRGQPIETTYFQELIADLSVADPEYKPWMVAISYEVEARGQPRHVAGSWWKK